MPKFIDINELHKIAERVNKVHKEKNKKRDRSMKKMATYRIRNFVSEEIDEFLKNVKKIMLKKAGLGKQKASIPIPETEEREEADALCAELSKRVEGVGFEVKVDIIHHPARDGDFASPYGDSGCDEHDEVQYYIDVSW